MVWPTPISCIEAVVEAVVEAGVEAREVVVAVGKIKVIFVVTSLGLFSTRSVTLVPKPGTKMAEERARTAAKGWLTRAAKKLEELLAVEEGVMQTGEWRAEGSAALGEFDNRMNVFETAQCNVEAVIAEGKLIEDIEKSGLFRDSFSKLRAKFEVALGSAADESSSGARSCASAEMKLPKLNLPLFDGQIEKWSLFWESFEVCVMKADLPEINKLAYLRSLLRGEAARCIDGLSLSAANFRAACDILQKRYGKPGRLIYLHVQGLLNLTGDMPLRELQEALLVHIRSLETLKVGGEKYGVVLTPMIVAKLPETVRLEWARTSEGKEGDLDNLLDFLATEIERQERSGQYAADGSHAADIHQAGRHDTGGRHWTGEHLDILATENERQERSGQYDADGRHAADGRQDGRQS